jgi:hypothetical protein
VLVYPFTELVAARVGASLIMLSREVKLKTTRTDSRLAVTPKLESRGAWNSLHLP